MGCFPSWDLMRLVFLRGREPWQARAGWIYLAGEQEATLVRRFFHEADCGTRWHRRASDAGTPRPAISCFPQSDQDSPILTASFHNYKWQSHCNGLFELPIAA